MGNNNEASLDRDQRTQLIQRATRRPSWLMVHYGGGLAGAGLAWIALQIADSRLEDAYVFLVLTAFLLALKAYDRIHQRIDALVELLEVEEMAGTESGSAD